MRVESNIVDPKVTHPGAAPPPRSPDLSDLDPPSLDPAVSAAAARGRSCRLWADPDAPAEGWSEA